MKDKKDVEYIQKFTIFAQKMEELGLFDLGIL